MYQSYRIENSAMIVSFAHAKGLHCTEETLTGFELAGKDKVYHEAKAVLKGEEIELTCDEVKEPYTSKNLYTEDIAGLIIDR